MTTPNTAPPGQPVELPPLTEQEEKALLLRVSQARTGMTVWMPFFGHLLLKLRPVVSRKIPTASVTQDRTLMLNPEFCGGLSDQELCGLLCHEVMHPALLYFERAKNLDVLVVGPFGITKLANFAHDFAINLDIHDMVKQHGDANAKVKLPPGGLLDEKWRGYSMEEIYDELLQEAAKNDPDDGDGDGDGGDGEEGEGGKQGKKQGQGGSGRVRMKENPKWGHDDCRPGDGSDPGDSTDKQKDPTGAGGGSTAKENENFWKQALIEAAQVHEQRGRGTLPGNIQKIINEILDPRVPWIDVLNRWLGEHGRRQDFSYHRPGRRSESVGETLPTVVKHGVDDVCILWDTSGSMHGRETEILAEVGGITEDLGLSVRVICCDAVVHSDTQGIDSALAVLEQGIVKGGGGSDFNPAFDLLTEDQFGGVLLVFTDGYISVPASKPELIKDVLWVLWKSDSDPTGGKWGEVLRVDEEGYAKK